MSEQKIPEICVDCRGWGTATQKNARQSTGNMTEENVVDCLSAYAYIDPTRRPVTLSRVAVTRRCLDIEKGAEMWQGRHEGRHLLICPCMWICTPTVRPCVTSVWSTTNSILWVKFSTTPFSSSMASGGISSYCYRRGYNTEGRDSLGSGCEQRDPYALESGSRLRDNPSKLDMYLGIERSRFFADWYHWRGI